MTRSYLQHGSRHLPTGTDPIPALAATVPAAIYVGDVSGGSPITINTGANEFFVKFAGCTTTNTDIFMLKGGSSPYFAQIPAGLYYWQLELDFGDAPPPQMEAIGTNPANLTDYGQFWGAPVWSSNTVFGHTDQHLVTPGTDDVIGVVQSGFDGLIAASGAIDDLNVAVLMENVVSASVVTGVILNLLKVNEYPANSAVVIP